MNTVETLARLPRATVEFANLILTTPDATIGATPRDVVWTHRQTTLYRYRSTRREHPIPVLLVFALINRPEIFDLRPGNSFVEYLLERGLRRVPGRLGRARRGGLRHGPGGVRLRRAALGDP